MEIFLDQDILSSNNKAASFNRNHFNESNTMVINIMSSPGAGKTTLLEKTIKYLSKDYRIGVIEGDLATEKDANRIREFGAKAVQINTNGTCHLDAKMIAKVLPEFSFQHIDLLFIENVGNLICPSNYDLGQEHKVVVLSVPEGNDKIVKYPVMFRRTELVLLNKIDLLPYLDFNVEQSIQDLEGINPESQLIQLSAQSEEGLHQWFEWIKDRYDKWLVQRV